MSRKFKVWMDSGANAFSCRTEFLTLDEIGIKDHEWDEMTEEEQEDLMREIAWNRADWGYAEIVDGDEE